MDIWLRILQMEPMEFGVWLYVAHYRTVTDAMQDRNRIHTERISGKLSSEVILDGLSRPANANDYREEIMMIAAAFTRANKQKFLAGEAFTHERNDMESHNADKHDRTDSRRGIMQMPQVTSLLNAPWKVTVTA